MAVLYRVDFSADEVEAVRCVVRGRSIEAADGRRWAACMVGAAFFASREEAVRAILDRRRSLVAITRRNHEDARRRLDEAAARLGEPSEERFCLESG